MRWNPSEAVEMAQGMTRASGRARRGDARGSSCVRNCVRLCAQGLGLLVASQRALSLSLTQSLTERVREREREQRFCFGSGQATSPPRDEREDTRESSCVRKVWADSSRANKLSLSLRERERERELVCPELGRPHESTCVRACVRKREMRERAGGSAPGCG